MRDIGLMILGGVGLLIVVPCVWLAFWCRKAIAYLLRWERENNGNTKNQDPNINV